MERNKKYRVQLREYEFVGVYLGPCPRGTFGIQEFNLFPVYHKLRVPMAAITSWEEVPKDTPNQEPHLFA